MAKWTTARITPAKNWPIAKIVPYEHNPRTHPAAQITLLAELIKKWGPDQDIVVDENGVILKGHGRRLAAAEAGLKVYPVRQRFGLSDEDKTAMRIADNQVALLSGWDTALVSFEVKRLERVNYDMKLLGFGEAQLVQFTTQPGPPAGGFQAFDEGIETNFCCPSCKYSWSGNPLAGKVKDGKPGDGNADSVRMSVRGGARSTGRSGKGPKVSSGPQSARKEKPGASKPAKSKS
jgi:hypothetical protein